MTKNFFLVLFSMVWLTSSAQNYKLLPDSCTYCFYTTISSYFNDYIAYYSIEKTQYTALNGKTYTHFINGGLGYTPYDTLLYLRQVDDEVYGIQKDSISEYLMMKFDVITGDTISGLMTIDGIDNLPYIYKAIVIDKDSILMPDGSYHSYMLLETDSLFGLQNGQGWTPNEIVWQEKGLCYAQNFTYPNISHGGLIYNFDELQLYPDNGYYKDPVNCSTDTLIPSNFYGQGHTCDSCNPVLNQPSAISELSTTLFNLLPNPTHKEVTLKISSEKHKKNLEYELIDLRGNVMKKGTVSSNSMVISLEELAPGIYLFVLSDKNGFYSSRKLVKY